MDGQLTLSALNSLIKESLENSFPEHLWVIAEIGELNVNRAGHCYIELVEKNNLTDEIIARSRATIWSWQFRFIQPYFETTTGQALKAGLKVLVGISIEFHEVYGLSLNIKDIDPNYTLGDMARKRQEIITKLIEEGIFDMNKEIPIPEIPSKIAVISSPTAAGYEDFIEQLHHNSSGYKFYTKLFPATMQGNNSVESIISALDLIYELEQHFDVVVIIRGGGSQMDLSCFDNYDLAFNITQFPLPILTGIGHEKDETIADLVANTKLKTPTAVAEFLIEQFTTIENEINELESLFFGAVDDLLNNETNRLEHALKLFKPLINSRIERTDLLLQQLTKNVKPILKEAFEQKKYALKKYSDKLQQSSTLSINEKLNQIHAFSSSTSYICKQKTAVEKQFIEEKQLQINRIFKRRLNKENEKITWLERTNQLVDPQLILKRGYSITLKNGKAVKNADELNQNDKLVTVLYNGQVETIVSKK